MKEKRKNIAQSSLGVETSDRAHLDKFLVGRDVYMPRKKFPHRVLYGVHSDDQT